MWLEPTAAHCSTTGRTRSNAPSIRPAANSTASSINPSAKPQITHESLGRDVKIDIALNSNYGTLLWAFTSLDPVTGLPPTDPSVGFLHPGEGGGVVFAAKPKPAVVTGTQVSDQAAVQFDAN